MGGGTGVIIWVTGVGVTGHHSSGSFHASNYIKSPHPSQLPQDDDSDPELPNSGTERHPIELSSDTTSYHGSRTMVLTNGTCTSTNSPFIIP
ncbi:hypothetical protein Hanom_Chr14g01300351 [Helianthus anomalus]